MTKQLSIGELRRRAPAGYLARASNARYSAYVLSSFERDRGGKFANEIGYGGDPRIAIGEAFRREAAISLELIIKAVIAQRAQNARRKGKQFPNVPMSHDVVQMWQNAKLPKLPDADQYRLIYVKSLLTWSGRYTAPKDDKTYWDEANEMKPFELVVSTKGDLRITRPRPFRFEDFDRLYRIAIKVYHELSTELDN